MRLSEAINLGRHLITLSPWVWSRGNRGCAICMGVAAIGKMAEWELDRNKRFEYWPWLMNTAPHSEALNRTEETFSSRVSWMAREVKDGNMTLDMLIDWVRSVEPAEKEAAPSETCQPVCQEHGQPK